MTNRKSIKYVSGCFAFLATLSNVFAQEGTPCFTPLQQSGVCIGIKACDSLLNLLKSQGPTQEVKTFLQQSACGWLDSFPLVCCPLKNSVNITEGRSQGELTAPSYKESILPQPPYCGFNNISSGRIVNGEPAKLGEFPWIVALGYKNENNPDQPKWLCGGTLITDRHILTAAHCVFKREDLYLARLGALDLYSDDDGSQPTMVEISEKKIHEQFDSSVSYSNDIAILTLAERNTNPTVYPICLPLEDSMQSNNFVNSRLFTAGWGALYFNGPTSSTLQTTLLPVVTNELCGQVFKNFRGIAIDQRVICAGYTEGGTDACQGDSGGPLMWAKPERRLLRFFQIGIVSFGFRCAEAGYPGVYTRVATFIDWIKQNVT